MKPDPDYSQFSATWPTLYSSKNYDRGLAAYFLTQSHKWAESAFDASDYFPKVLEIGAGTGIHAQYVRHRFEEYWQTDFSEEMVSEICPPNVPGKFFKQRENALSLSFADASFDRLIAAHVLEHLPNPHLALREWVRVLKPDGVLTLLLPCDPGFLWRLGRHVGVRKKFQTMGFEYDYWMAREHVNSITNLLAFVRYYFPVRAESWQPFKVASSDLNLFYICHIFLGSRIKER